MSASLNENTQYIDPTTGELLDNGLVYIGANNTDAELNPITIYADVGLTTVLSNPQRIGADGRVSNKVFIPGKYSLKVKDADNNQKLNDLSLGEAETISNTPLINVQGTDDIIADDSPAIISLVDGQTYVFTSVAANTGAMTLKIDTTTAYPIKKHHDANIELGDIEDHQIVSVIWNSIDSVFELTTNTAALPAIKEYDNIAALRAITVAPQITLAKAKGYYTDGDGGAIPGGYYWDAASTEADNGGTILKATAITTGRWKGIYSGAVQMEWFGVFNGNISELITLNIEAGDFVSTKGYSSAGDGGAANYLVKSAADYGASPDEYGDHTLANGNIAVFQSENKINSRQLGIRAINAPFQRLNNNHIQAPDGNRFIVRGVVMFDYLFVTFEARTNYNFRNHGIDPSKNETSGISEPTYNADTVYVDAANVRAQLLKAKRTGVNLIRVAVEPAIMFASVSYVDGGTTYPSDPAMLDTIINIADSLNIVVQLQNGNDAVLTADNVTFMRWLKDRYYLTRNVWINPANEINGTNADVNDPIVWEAEMEQYVDALREDVTGEIAGTKFINPVCIDPPGYATRIDLIDTILSANTTFSEDPNLIINIHFYPQAGGPTYASDTDWLNGTQYPVRQTEWINYIGRHCVVIGECGIDNVPGRLDPNLDAGVPSINPTWWANAQSVMKDFLAWADRNSLHGSQAGASPIGDMNGVIGHTWFVYVVGLSTHSDNTMYLQDGSITTWGTIFKDYFASAKRSLLRSRYALGSQPDGTWSTGDIKDNSITPAKMNLGWTAFIPVVTAGAGSITAYTATGNYMQLGKIVNFQIDVILTTNGTGASYLDITLPSAPGNVDGFNASVSGIIRSNGWSLATIALIGTQTIRAYLYNGSYPGTDGRTFNISGSYQIS